MFRESARLEYPGLLNIQIFLPKRKQNFLRFPYYILNFKVWKVFTYTSKKVRRQQRNLLFVEINFCSIWSKYLFKKLTRLNYSILFRKILQLRLNLTQVIKIMNGYALSEEKEICFPKTEGSMLYTILSPFLQGRVV